MMNMSKLHIMHITWIYAKYVKNAQYIWSFHILRVNACEQHFEIWLKHDFCCGLMKSPGILEPLYSSSTEMKAQSNCLMPLSVWDSTEKRRRSLQYHTLSGLSSNPPDSMPGGRTKTISWRFAILSFFSENGQHEIRCTPEYFLCPIVSEKNNRMCPFDLADFTTCKVSSKARTWYHAG